MSGISRSSHTTHKTRTKLPNPRVPLPEHGHSQNRRVFQSPECRQVQHTCQRVVDQAQVFCATVTDEAAFMCSSRSIVRLTLPGTQQHRKKAQRKDAPQLQDGPRALQTTYRSRNAQSGSLESFSFDMLARPWCELSDQPLNSRSSSHTSDSAPHQTPPNSCPNSCRARTNSRPAVNAETHCPSLV